MKGDITTGTLRLRLRLGLGLGFIGSILTFFIILYKL
jgi:hypothetical protein